MISNLKYIIFEDESFIIFSSGNSHSEMANSFYYRKPISAGYARSKENKIVCFGDSMSLNLKSREGMDDEIINRGAY